MTAPTTSTAASPNIAAINALSAQFEQNLAAAPHNEFTETITLVRGEGLPAKGEDILRRYEAECCEYPDDPHVLEGLHTHLVRMAGMLIECLHPSFVRDDASTGKEYSNSEAAEEACAYLQRAYQMEPSAWIGFQFSTVFATAGFNATAIWWLREAETLANQAGNQQIVAVLRARRKELEAEGPALDPVLNPSDRFPTAETPGLNLDFQPARLGPKPEETRIEEPLGPIATRAKRQAAAIQALPPEKPRPQEISPSISIEELRHKASDPTGQEKKSGPCYIATACYGSYDHPDVRVFRNWRDDVLLKSRAGREFVAWYYRLSPALAGRLGPERVIGRVLRRLVLQPLARALRETDSRQV